MHLAVSRDVDQFKVLDPVVIADAIAVVHLVLGRNRAVGTRPDVAVLKPRPPVHDDGNVAVGTLVSGATLSGESHARVAVLMPPSPMFVAQPSAMHRLRATLNGA